MVQGSSIYYPYSDIFVTNSTFFIYFIPKRDFLAFFSFLISYVIFELFYLNPLQLAVTPRDAVSFGLLYWCGMQQYFQVIDEIQNPISSDAWMSLKC